MNTFTRAVPLLFLPLLAFTASAAPESPVRKPNVVIIYTDDLGYADIGPFFDRKEGDKGYSTPNLDRLAAEGTRFTDFYTAQAVCSASRAALMTGCYPNRVGVVGALMPHSKTGISKDETTLAEVCKSQGYATACFGKWHLGDAREFLPLQHGFDEYFGLPYSNDMTPLGTPHGVVPNQHANDAPLPLIAQNAVVNPSVDDKAQNMLTTWYTEHAVDFIHRNKDKPFFLYLPHTMVHVPLQVSPRFRGKSKRGLYGDAVEEIDWSIGQIMEALKRDGLNENTLVMFSSDNGPWLRFGDHGGSAFPLREGKGTSWDGGVRVPTIMRWPGRVPASRTSSTPLMTIDMLPTVAKLIGAPMPEHKIDGLDISDVLTGKSDQPPHEALFFYYGANDLEAMRSGKWKLEFPRNYLTLDGKPGGSGGKKAPYATGRIASAQLYDLEADPGQKSDVAAKNPEVIKELTALADKMRAELGDGLTKQTGSAVRKAGRVDKDSVYPSDDAFEKKPNPVYAPE